MAANSESVDQSDNNLRVKGDLGDLQIVEELSDSEDEVQVENTVASLPDSLLQANSGPAIGSVAVTNSDNVHFGNKLFFNGPVTIKQVVQSRSGIDNDSYHKTEDDSIPKSDSAETKPPTSPKFQIKPWHKLSLLAIAISLLSSITAVLVLTQIGPKENRHPARRDGDNSSRHAQVTVHCYDWAMIIIWVILIPITVLIGCFYSLLTNRSSSLQKSDSKKEIIKGSTDNYHNWKGDLLIAPDHLRIVSRTDWLAQPVEEPIDVLKHPTPWVIITHTATGGCTTQSECVLRVRGMQTYHIESKGWSDIGYNFLIGGDGSAYYGRGWDQVGAHTLHYNSRSIGIAFIGLYNNQSPTNYQLQACKNLIKQGVKEGKIAKDYKLFAHRQLMSTLSPGDKIFEIIKTWPHFVKDVDPSMLAWS